jgi:hypothetical protein
VELVPGLGEEAYLDGPNGLFVLSDGTVLFVGTQFIQPDSPAVLRALAEIALAPL